MVILIADTCSGIYFVHSTPTHIPSDLYFDRIWTDSNGENKKSEEEDEEEEEDEMMKKENAK